MRNDVTFAPQWVRDAELDLQREERARLRRIVGWTMAAAGAACTLGLAIALALWPVEGRAQDAPLYVHERQEVTVRLMPKACTDGVSLMMIATVPPQYAEGWRAIESTWLMRDGSRRNFAGCWLELSPEQAVELSGGQVRETTFLLVFSDQTANAITKAEFLRRRGQVGT